MPTGQGFASALALAAAAVATPSGEREMVRVDVAQQVECRKISDTNEESGLDKRLSNLQLMKLGGG